MIKKDCLYDVIRTEEILLDPREAAARLQTSIDHTDELTERCDEKVRAVIDCRFCSCRVSASVSDGKADLGFGDFFSHDLSAALDGCDEAYLFAVTLGHGVDRLITRLSAISATEGFISDALASAYAEAAADMAEKIIKGEGVCRPRFSIGYGDLPLSVQEPFLDFLSAGKLLGVTLGKNLLMSPKKTITAIMGIKK